MAPIKQIYQLKVTLEHIEPPITRTIQVSSTYSFWDLHSVIQDAFGWSNSHLHQFIYTDPATNQHKVFGIPSDEDDLYDMKIYTGWSNKIAKYLNSDTPTMLYIYDLGDSWEHIIELEKVLLAEQGVKYPRCIDGKRNSPPEDCGGVPGYANILEILFDPTDPEYEDTKEWVDSVKECIFDPEEFKLESVRFMSPKKRFDESFE